MPRACYTDQDRRQDHHPPSSTTVPGNARPIRRRRRSSADVNSPRTDFPQGHGARLRGISLTGLPRYSSLPKCGKVRRSIRRWERRDAPYIASLLLGKARCGYGYPAPENNRSHECCPVRPGAGAEERNLYVGRHPDVLGRACRSRPSLPCRSPRADRTAVAATQHQPRRATDPAGRRSA